MNIDLSIIVLSWNDRPHLEVCLESLRECGSSRTMEVIVVDNASSDGSPELVEERFPTVRLIRNTENIGFARGNNMAIKESHGKYVCLLNSDIKLLPGCLAVLADYLDRQPRIGILGPRILNADLSHQSSCRRFPGLWNNFCSATGLATAFRGSRFLSGEHMFFFHGDRVQDVDVLVGCFWMARRAAIAEFGMLDERFFMYAEDVDWCRCCWNAGWRVVFLPGAQAIHFGGGSSAKQDPVWVAMTQQQSALLYWKKHHGSIGRTSIGALIFVHKLVRLASAIVSRFLTPSNREERKVRIRVMSQCLKALLVPHGGSGGK